MRGRELFGHRFIAAFVISSIIFSLLFLFAYGIAYWNYQELTYQTNSLTSSIRELDDLIARFSCDSSLLVSSSTIFDEAAVKLNLLEKRFGKGDSRVIDQKKIYSELEYRHLLIVERFNRECNTSFIPLLFFYSNINRDVERVSERMGFIITSFDRQQADRVMVYSFDYYLDSPVVQVLTERYNVTSAPLVVFNYSEPFFLRDIDQLYEL